MKKIFSLSLGLLMLATSCSNNNSQPKTATGAAKVTNISEKKLAADKGTVTLTDYLNKPDKVSDKEKENVGNFLKSNNIFSYLPYTSADKYLVQFTQDGGPALFTGDGGPAFKNGFTGDGGPAFSTKANTLDNYT